MEFLEETHMARYHQNVIFCSQAGGSKAGTFDVYPHHSEDPYNSQKMQLGGNGKRKGGVFRSSVGPKSKPTSSTLKQNITRYFCSRAISY